MPVVKTPETLDTSEIVYKVGVGMMPKSAVLYRIENDPLRGVWISKISGQAAGVITNLRADTLALYAKALYKEVVKRGYRVPILGSGRSISADEALGYTFVFVKDGDLYMALSPTAGLPVDIEIPTWTWRI
jgi:hypothetical protein